MITEAMEGVPEDRAKRELGHPPWQQREAMKKRAPRRINRFT
jgi:hypothetical protein